MSSDWRSNIDRHQRQQAQSESTGTRLAKMVAGTIMDAILTGIESHNARKDARRYSRLARFKCHVPGCNYHSQQPGQKVGGQVYTDGMDHQKGSYSDTYVDDFSTPGDLTRCSRCHNWACNKDHIHNGICMTCGRNL